MCDIYDEETLPTFKWRNTTAAAGLCRLTLEHQKHIIVYQQSTTMMI